MNKDGFTRIASLLKARDNKLPPSITTGIVISPPPEPRIRLDEIRILYKEQLIFAAHMLGRYERNIKFTDHDVSVDTKMEWTDTIISGDEVILIPVVDGQLYYVIDKAVRF